MKNRAQEIFEQTVDLVGDERFDAVERLCAGDEQLRNEVESLLSSHDNAGDFLGAPTVDHVDAYSVPSEEAGITIGRYKLLERIGQGGFGDVFMAQQLEPVKRRVALKIIKLGMDTKQVIARFEAERQALALMDHPNIARVLDGGETSSGRPYFVMELVRGDPITEYCDRECVATQGRLRLFQQVCHAIQHAHQKGVIHRDIKPSNVLVTVADGRPLVKVIDFGIAKATNTELTDKTLFTEFRQLIGTPQYMSPEQAERSGVDIDTRSDIYSLGVLLYELLTGRTPVDVNAMKTAVWEEVQRMIREDEPTRPSTLLTSLGADSQVIAKRRGTDIAKLGNLLRADLDWIVLKSLEKDRTRRYGAASELADDVQRYLNDEPVSATPPSTVYRFRKLARRHRTAILVTAVVACSLLVGIVTTTLMALEARDAAYLARVERQKALQAAREAEQQRTRALRMAAMVATNKLDAKTVSELTDAWKEDLSQAETSHDLDPRSILEQRCQLAVWWYEHGGGEDAAKMIEQIYDEAKLELGTEHPVLVSLVNANIVSHFNVYDAGRKADLFGDLVDSMRRSAPASFPALLPQYAAALANAGRNQQAADVIDQYLGIRNGSQPNPEAAALESMRLASAINELSQWGEAFPNRMQQLERLQTALVHTGPNIFRVTSQSQRFGSRQVWEGQLEGGDATLRLRFTILRDEEGKFFGEVISLDQDETSIPLTRMDVSDGKVTMEFESMAARYEGTTNEDNTECTGTWHQNGIELPLTIKRIGS
ncbi:MAG: serine/threonine-protein kinase [Pirellulaceae bacterium]